MRVFTKVLVGILCLWAIGSVGLNSFGISLYWPFFLSEEPIPEHRLLIARNGVLLTFAYYGFLFLKNSYGEVLPSHFLKVFLFMTSIAGVLVTVELNLYETNELLSILLLFLCGIIIHAGSKDSYRHYFTDGDDNQL